MEKQKFDVKTEGDLKKVEAPAEEALPTDLKSVLASKTIWVNLLAIVAFVVQSKFGYTIDAEMQVWILSGVNIALRMVTKKPVKW